MVCLPWVVRVGTFTTNVADDSVVSDSLSRLAISARVKDFFLGITLCDLLVCSVVRSLVCITAILASGKSAADNTGSQESHD